MTNASPKVDAYLAKAPKWRREMERFRELLLGRGLAEEFKWGKPCYAFQNSNLTLIVPLKESCALMFCKGALLKDAKGILSRPGEHSQSTRWFKVTSAVEIDRMTGTLEAYLDEAIAAEKAGKKVVFKKSPEPVPAELKAKWKEMPSLEKAFKALTPGRQRGYILFFSGAKQAQTRTARIEKHVKRILAGKGLND